MPGDEGTSRSSISVRFWGVRGSIACPGPSTLRYGGNTPCVEVRCGTDTLIFDAGTGIRPLGNALVEAANTNDFDIFLSHGHIDHMIGLPFFAPLFVTGQVVRVWAGTLQPAGGVKEAVRKLMSFPFFPLQVDALHAKLEFHDFRAGDVINPRPGVTLRTAPLNHPGGAIGYRIEYGGQCRRLCDRYRIGRRPDRPGGADADQGCRSRHPGYDLHRRGTAGARRLGPFELAAGRPAGERGRGKTALPVSPRSRARRRVHGQDQSRGGSGEAGNDRGERGNAGRSPVSWFRNSLHSCHEFGDEFLSQNTPARCPYNLR